MQGGRNRPRSSPFLLLFSLKSFLKRFSLLVCACLRPLEVCKAELTSPPQQFARIMSVEQQSKNQAWGGAITKFKTKSSSLGGLETNFNVFTPSTSNGPFPVLYYLAGLTCTEDTGAQKGGFLRDAAQHGIALVFPDTSPRGAGIDGEEESWDFGTGAGFYLDATADKWSKHYMMESFVTKELPELLGKTGLPLDLKRSSVFGHSMVSLHFWLQTGKDSSYPQGGHGALTLYLKYPELYKSASGFAPICEPTKCQWGDKAFTGYLSGGIEEGAKHDTVYLLKQAPKDRKLAILVDSGTGDNFYKDGQLRPESLQEAIKSTGREGQIQVNLRDGYDHSCVATPVCSC